MRCRAQVFWFAAVAMFAASAHADEAADTATARALGIEGVTLADAGRCSEAIEKLDRAERLHHAPTTATRLAECEIETGKLVLGTERLQRVVREPLAPTAHPAFHAAVARAQAMLVTTSPRLATLRLSVSGPSASKLSILIDGEPASSAILDTNRRTDPGTHAIHVSAPGYFPSSVSTSLGDGETRSVAIELKPDPKAVLVADGKSASSHSSSAERGVNVPAMALFGIAAVGLGVGIYGSLRVDDRASELSTRCDANRICPTGLKSAYDDAQRWTTVSTAGFITAGAGVSLGGLLLLLSRGRESSPAKAASVRPALGPTSVGVDGVF